MAGLRVPLHLRPHGRRRMTEGQDGSLHLSCTALTSATPCRFSPALSLCPHLSFVSPFVSLFVIHLSFPFVICPFVLTPLFSGTKECPRAVPLTSALAR